MFFYSLGVLIVIIFACSIFYHYQWNPETIRGIFRPFYKDHTIFGATVTILAIFWILFIFEAKTITFKIIYLILALIFLFGVVLSTSRAAILSVIFGATIWVLFLLKVRIKHMLFACVIGIAVLIIFRDQVYKLFYENKYVSHTSNASYWEQIESSSNISSDLSNLERINRWVSGLKMFEVKPFVGFGPGTYQFEYIPYQKPELMNRLSVLNPWHPPENSGGTAHSEYVLALSEMGICGMVSLLLLFGRWFWIAFNLASFHHRRSIIIIAFTVISTYMFHALFNNFLNTDKFAFLFWGFSAWMTANYELKSHDTNKLLS